MIQDHTQHIGVMTVSVHIPHAQSLKEKRHVLRSLKDHVRNKFNVSMAQLDGEDKWQTALLGFCMINRDQRHINSALENLNSFLHGFPGMEICDTAIEFY